jgi:hypothetical protein
VCWCIGANRMIWLQQLWWRKGNTVEIIHASKQTCMTAAVWCTLATAQHTVQHNMRGTHLHDAVLCLASGIRRMVSPGILLLQAPKMYSIIMHGLLC